MTQPPEQPPVGQPPQRYGPPVSPGPYPHYPQPKKNFWTSTGGVFAIIGIVIGAVFVLCLGVGVVGMVGDSNDAAKLEVKVTSCKVSGGDILPAAVMGYTVTNNGTNTHSVSIKIEYRDASGARIDTDTAYVRDVKPGDTVRGEETTLLDASPLGGSINCAIVDVS